MAEAKGFDWRTIVALNTVSTLAQIGQFGIAFVMLPVWLAAQGLDAAQLGMFAASLWLGQLPGLGLAPWLCQKMGSARVIVLGLACTVVAMVWIPLGTWPGWMVAGALAGMGLGLRWIGLEPWMYRIAPSHARGRLVGFHETLIGLAPIVAPLLAGIAGPRSTTLFWMGAGFAAVALVPLLFARTSVEDREPRVPSSVRTRRDGIFHIGVVIALLGGMMEAALSGLFPLFAQNRQFTPEAIAQLLAVFGVGGLLLQYGIGALADHKGLAWAARVNALGTVLVALTLALPLQGLALQTAVFLLGGCITSFLTLALIASTTSASGSMAANVSQISMLYTGSAVLGPLLAAGAMEWSGNNGLMWFTAAAALAMLTLLAGKRPWAPRAGMIVK